MNEYINYENKSNYLYINVLIQSIDLLEAPKLSKEVMPVLEEFDYPHTIMNLKNLSYINSAGLGCLVGIHNELKRHESRVVFICNDEKIMRIMNITGVIKIISVFSTIAEAEEKIKT